MECLTFADIQSKAKKAENFWYTVFYWCSSHIVWMSLRLQLTPNQLSYSGFLLNAVGALYFLFSAATRRDVLIAASILALAHVFDCADGQLAFVTNQRSAGGRWLDSTLDFYKHGLLASCFFKLLMVREFNDLPVAAVWARDLGFCLAIGGFINYAVLAHATQYRSAVDPYYIRPLGSKNIGRLKRSLISHGGEYANLLLSFALFAVKSEIGYTAFILVESSNLFLATHRVYRIAKHLASTDDKQPDSELSPTRGGGSTDLHESASALTK